MTGRITLKTKAQIVYRELCRLYPKTSCFLHFSKDYELLFAVILSAQATDKSVNEATSVLFKEFPKLEDYNPNNRAEIKSIIKSVGLANSKVEYLIKTAQILLEQYDGKVPQDRKKLMELSGVGFKTSGVVLGELFNEKLIPVDTHISRVTKRIGLVSSELSNDEIEVKLERLFSEDRSIDLHRKLILFGRNICKAQAPDCSSCPFTEICRYYKLKKNDTTK